MAQGMPLKEERSINGVVVSLLEAEGSSDSPGTPPAPTVFWDPDLASLEDSIRKRAQCHCVLQPVHPETAPVLHFIPTREQLGARLHPFP